MSRPIGPIRMLQGIRFFSPGCKAARPLSFIFSLKTVFVFLPGAQARSVPRSLPPEALHET